MKAASERKPASLIARGAVWFLGIVCALFVAGVLVGPGGSGGTKSPESAAMQTSRTLQLCLYQFAGDHGGKYPTGSSSTEVFQKLVDEQYLTATEILYLSMPGKVKTTSNHLKPENVCFDVTAGMTDKTPDDVPGVFITGYQIDYRPGGSAVRLSDHAQPDAGKDGIAIAYHSNNAFYKIANRDGSGAVTNIVPADATIGPGPYTQLTPDGPLNAK